MAIDLKSLWKNEDWIAFWISFIIFVLSIYSFFGWLPKINALSISLNKIFTLFSEYNYLGAFSILLLYIFTLIILSIGAKAMNINLKDFTIGYTIIFFASYFIWIVSHYLYIYYLVPLLSKFLNVNALINISSDIGYIFALIAGLTISTLIKNLPKPLEVASKSFWYIKIGILIIAVLVSVDILKNSFFPANLIEAIFIFALIYIIIAWSISFYISSKMKISKEESSIIASGSVGTSISSIIISSELFKAPPMIIGILSSILVALSTLKLLILPFIGYILLKDYPIVASVWITSSLKTDCTAVSGGQILDTLISSNRPELQNLILYTSILSKIAIDSLLILWIFILSLIFYSKEEKKSSPIYFIYKIPKFVVGFSILFSISIFLQLVLKMDISNTYIQLDSFKQLFFLITFFSIGLSTNLERIKKIKTKKIILAFLITWVTSMLISIILSLLIFSNMTLNIEEDIYMSHCEISNLLITIR